MRQLLPDGDGAADLDSCAWTAANSPDKGAGTGSACSAAPFLPSSLRFRSCAPTSAGAVRPGTPHRQERLIRMQPAAEKSHTPSRPLRHDWQREEAAALYRAPFNDLVFAAHTVHRRSFDPNRIQMSRLLSIKTGGCAEDCGYCSQSQHFKTATAASKLMDAETVIAAARDAKAGGAQRFCMGAAWRSPKDRDVEQVCALVEGVKALGMETCATLGMLTSVQARRLKQSGLDYYNHNLDTSPEFYGSVWQYDATHYILYCAGAWMAVGNALMYRMVNFRI